MPTQADAECQPFPPDGSLGCGTTKVPVTVLYVAWGEETEVDQSSVYDQGECDGIPFWQTILRPPSWCCMKSEHS